MTTLELDNVDLDTLIDCVQTQICYAESSLDQYLATARASGQHGIIDGIDEKVLDFLRKEIDDLTRLLRVLMEAHDLTVPRDSCHPF